MKAADANTDRLELDASFMQHNRHYVRVCIWNFEVCETGLDLRSRKYDDFRQRVQLRFCF